MTKGLMTLCVILSFAITPAHADWAPLQDGEMPANALAVGEGSGPRYYVCRAPYQGGLHPGLVGSAGTCDIVFNGAQYSLAEFEVLIDEGYGWAGVQYGGIPFDAFPAGREQQGDTLYICRGDVEARWMPGKISRTYSGCSIPLEGREVKAAWYEVLVKN